jgi:hypothetical protein
MSSPDRAQAYWLNRDVVLVAGPGDPLALAPLALAPLAEAPLAEVEAEPEAEL